MQRKRDNPTHNILLRTINKNIEAMQLRSLSPLDQDIFMKDNLNASLEGIPRKDHNNSELPNVVSRRVSKIHNRAKGNPYTQKMSKVLKRIETQGTKSIALKYKPHRGSEQGSRYEETGGSSARKDPQFFSQLTRYPGMPRRKREITGLNFYRNDVRASFNFSGGCSSKKTLASLKN